MENQNYTRNEMERVVTDQILKLGVPANIKGYRFLREGIMMVLNDMEMVESVTKLLYPGIAKRYGTTDKKVERAIRNAVETSWKRGDEKVFLQLFGYSQNTGRTRPTNSEFIARVADEIQIAEGRG